MEEISLKEIIKTLLKGWKWIVFAAAMGIAVALTYVLLQPKTYASEAALKVSTININPLINSDGTGSSLIGDIASVAQVPIMDINSYAKQLVDDPVLANTVSALGLRGEEGAFIPTEHLKGKITVRMDEKANILYVSVRDKNAETAADMANALAEQLRVYLAETIRQNCEVTADNINRQLIIQKGNIDAVTEQLKVYTEGPNNAQEIESLIAGQIAQISRYKSELNDIERSLQADTLALDALRNIVDDAVFFEKSVSATVNIPSSGARTRYFKNAAGEDASLVDGNAPMEITVESESDIENIVLTVKKAELEARLVQNGAEYDALLTSLASMEDDLSHMTGVLAEEKHQYDILQREYQLAGEIYAQYQKIHRQIPVIISSDLAHKNLQILSHASAAAQPENQSAMFYAAIGGVLGLFLGIFAVLFRNYWTQIPAQT